MKKSVAFCCALALIGLAATASAAEIPPPRDAAYPGALEIHVDATDLARRIFRVRERIPATPGPLVLLYPQWLPGHHSPSGPISKLAGLIVHAAGKRLEWKRDPLNVYAFHVDVPEGADAVDVEFEFLSPQDRRQGRVVMTPDMLNLQWNATTLYPGGYYANRIEARASVTLPQGFELATALEVASREGNTVTFKPVDYDTLVDSPIYAGRHFKRVPMDPKGHAQPVYMDFVADSAKALEMTDEQIKLHRNVVAQADKLYGARHFDKYTFLVSLSDKMSGQGLEHHRSSENGVGADYFSAWDKNWAARGLFPHEYNHSWNGKYRRSAESNTANFNLPMDDGLLWVYEGQTQFYGNVLAARAGLVSKEQALDLLASVAATYDRNRPGLAWRTLADTTNDPTIAQRAPLPYRNYQMSEDYYSGGELVWLAVDMKLRELSRGKRSLDDFARAFFGMDNGVWKVNPYTLDDVVETLNGIVAFDWHAFLRARIEGHGPLIDGIAASGWKLVYSDQPSTAVKAYESFRHSTDLVHSIGLMVGSKGELVDVRWDSPAFKAGIGPGMSLVAVNGREYKGEVLKDAITAAAKDTNAPLEILIKDFDTYRSVRIDYRDGLKYPHLERIEGKPDLLSKLLAPR